MTDKQAALLKAGEAALRIDAAKAGVEAAKAAVEAARAALEEAKGAVDRAKADFEAALDACEEAGIPKAKARKAVESLNQVWIEAGIVDAPEATAANERGESQPQPRRKRRAKEEKKASVPAEGQPSASAPDGEASGTAQSRPDFAEEVQEIESLIAKAVSAGGSSSASLALADRLLRLLLSAFAEAAADGRRPAVVDFESFASVLDEGAAKELAAGNAELDEALAAPEAGHALAWFRSVIDALEDCKEVPSFEFPVADASSEGNPESPSPADAAVDSSSEESPVVPEASASDAPMAAEEGEADGGDLLDPSHDDFLPDLPDVDEGYDDSYPVEDDDRSFPEDGPGDDFPEEIEVVNDIGSINFLEDSGGTEVEPPAEEPAPTPAAKEPEKPAATAPQPGEQSRPRGGFVPPSFLKPRS